MGALFELFGTLVVTLATAAFAHFGVAAEDSDQNRAEPPRVVERSAVLPAASQAFVTVARR